MATKEENKAKIGVSVATADANPVIPVDPKVDASVLGTNAYKLNPDNTASAASLLNGLVTSSNSEIVNAKAASEKARTTVDENLGDIKTISDSLVDKSKDQLAEETAAGIPEIKQNLNELRDISRKKNLEYDTTPYSLAGQGRGITTGILRGQEAVKQRALAVDIMLNNSNIQAMEGKLTLAQETADKAIKAKYDPLVQKLENIKFFFTQNSELLTKAEKKLADEKTANINLQLKELETKMQDEKDAASIRLKAIETGNKIPNDILTSTNGKDAKQTLAILSPYMAKPDIDIRELKNGTVLRIDKATGKVLNTYNYGNENTSVAPVNATPGTKAVSSVADLITGFSSDKARAAFMKGVGDLAKKGDDKGIAERIVGQSLSNISDADTRKRTTGGFLVSLQLTRLGELLHQFEDAGGETGLIAGNKQKITQKLGQLGNPTLANLGTQILNTLDTLARSRTGAVITPAEEKLYDRILPGIDKVGKLNDVIIAGLKDSLMADVENNLRFSITSDGLDVIKTNLPDVFADNSAQYFEQSLAGTAPKTKENVAQSIDSFMKDILTR